MRPRQVDGLLQGIILLLLAINKATETSPKGSTVENCPCLINAEGTNVTCSHQALTELPQCIPRTAKHINLSDNNFSNFTSGIFKDFRDLEQLSLAQNDIEFLPEGTFDGLESLSILDLSFNNLTHKESFAANVFSPLKTLQRLYIQGNCNSESGIKCVYPDRALFKAPTVKFLQLDGLKGIPLGNGFSSLKHLHTLIMSSENGFCNLGHVPHDMFRSLRSTNISVIDLYDCDARSILPNTFSHLRNLQWLRISYDRHFDNTGLVNVTLGLNSTSIKTLILTDLFHNPGVVQFPPSVFAGIHGTSLELLDLSGNKILSIPPKSIFNLPLSLKLFSLRQNILNDGNFLMFLTYLKNLEVLDISFQHFIHTGISSERVYDKVRHGNQATSEEMKKHIALAEISDCSNCRWTKVIKENTVAIMTISQELYNLACNNLQRPGPQKDDTSLYKSNATDEQMNSNIYVRLKNITSPYKIKLPANLKTLIMNNIKFDGQIIPPLTFQPNVLEYINASRCLFSAFLGPWEGMAHLKVIDISDNEMTTVKPDSMTGFPNLKRLYLQKNRLGKTIAHDVHCETLSAQTELEILDLSDNGISTLPTCFFQTLWNATWISLAQNTLTAVTFKMDSLTKLKFLNLSYNQLSSFTDQNINEMERISSGRELMMDIRENKWRCNCQTIHIIDWFIKTDIVFVHREDLYCVFVNGSLVSFSQMHVIRDALVNECYAWIVVTACAVTFVSLILILGFVSMILYKWKTYTYLFRTGQRTLNPYHRMRQEHVAVTVDAYLSYDGDYEVFGNKSLHEVVTNMIYKPLVERGLRVMIRDNLTSGQMISNLISDAIPKCHKVVIFLTPQFCKEYANMHEFHVAAYEGIYTNRRMIIPVFVGDINKQDLSSDISAYLETENIVRFPNAENKLRDFTNIVERRIRHW